MLSNEITHSSAAINGTELHYLSAGEQGSPILLVHGFPETSWAFHKLMPLLAEKHRVFAVDLRGFGDSSHNEGDYSSAASAEDLHQLIGALGIGPVHITTQDISGGTVFRLAATHPEELLSVTAIETGLAGFGFEKLAGTWYIRILVTPGIPEMLLRGRERELIDWAFEKMTRDGETISDDDRNEFARAYGVQGGWRGASGLYSSALADGDELQALAKASPVSVPVLAIGASGGPSTADTFDKVSAAPVSRTVLEGVGHYVALEAPERLASAILGFVDGLSSRTEG
ncbi:MAG: alpha/beta hydrolase [Rhodoglobus sp.]